MRRYKFKTLGVMIDMSRNSVMSMDGLKRLLPLLRKMGYNCLMLYTEDTYEVDGEPYFGYRRGRYSKAEMKEIDSFAESLGIKVIPCIQTLAHLNAAKKWKKMPYDCDDILLVDDERTYELIDNMFSTISECFKSRVVHIGMDEAHMIGRGKHLDLHGYESPSEIMKRHMDRVCKLAEKYNFEPMIWSDMFYRPWNNGKYYTDKSISEEYRNVLPPDVIPVYWDYYHKDKKDYDDMLDSHMELSKKTWFAGGIWGWRGVIPFNKFSIETMIPAIDSCIEHKVENIVMTIWGNDGGECSHFAKLPSLFYIASYAKGERDDEVIKRKFKSLTGLDFDECLAIDDVNLITGNEFDGHPKNPSKYMLYSDCLNGYLDTTVKPGAGVKFAEIAVKLHATAKKSRKYGYVFDTAAKLADVMEIKYELGIKTRAAYTSADLEELRRLANEDYVEVAKRVNLFAKALEKQWMLDNKAVGLEVFDIRLGGLVKRLDTCRRRILDYVNGRIDKIDELEEDLLPWGASEESIDYNNALGSMTRSCLI